MRLDHLLSKEHLVRLVLFAAVVDPGADSDRTCPTVAHGWNIDSAAGADGAGLSTLRLSSDGGCWNGSGSDGPAGARCWVLRDQASLPYRDRFDPGWWGLRLLASRWASTKHPGSGWAGWCRSYVENYTVDASILDRSHGRSSDR